MLVLGKMDICAMFALSTTKGDRNRGQVRKTTEILYYVNDFKDVPLKLFKNFSALAS